MLSFPLEPFWTVSLLLGWVVYLLVLVRVRRGLGALAVQSPAAQISILPKVSVIIPCRDEARFIGSALDDLAAQDYPPELLQVIVVDDRSKDGTGNVAQAFSNDLRNLSVLRIETCPARISPKKHAISRGLEMADGEIIITTDGDCRFQPGWVRALIAEFAPDVGLVTGLTIFHRGTPEPFWQRMQQLDYLSHSFLAAGAIASGWAFNCNGSNLALRRRAFSDVGGYDAFQQIVTGDDTLLLQRLRGQGHWRLRFCAHPQSVVRSWPEETPAEVFNQRLRWGSGGLAYQPRALCFALSTFVFFCALLASPWLWLSGMISAVWAFILLLKILQEALVMKTGFRTFRIESDWLAFGAVALLHVPAILTFSSLGHLLGFRWKGEKFRRTRNQKSNN